MKTGPRGIALIKEFEGLRLAAYQDSVGVWTIGYGHTLGVTKGDTCSESQASRWLAQDVEYAEQVVNSHVWAKLTQGQFDALVSFVFNVGPGKAGVKDGFVVLKNGHESTMLRCLRDGDYHSAADQFQYWVHAGGIKLAGLIRRRAAEKDLFVSDDQIPTAKTDAELQMEEKIAKARSLLADAISLLNSIG